MRSLFFLLVLLPGLAYGKATPVRFTVLAPSTVEYSVSNSQSRIQECSGNTVKVVNKTSESFYLGFGTATTAPGLDFTFVPAGDGAGHSFNLNLNSGNYIYFRSPDGAVTSDGLDVSCTAEDK